jgi:hypothetical protein
MTVPCVQEGGENGPKWKVLSRTTYEDETLEVLSQSDYILDVFVVTSDTRKRLLIAVRDLEEVVKVKHSFIKHDDK